MILKDIIKDKIFLRTMLILALPIALENLVNSVINMADVFMIGQLGEAEIAGVGLANQIFFIFVLVLFGTNTGTGIFIAQYWGKQDYPNIHKALGLALWISLAISSLFFLLAIFAPQFLIAIYSKDLEVIRIGGSYLKIVSLAFPFTAIIFVYSFALRSVGKAVLAMYLSFLTLIFNVGLDYLLIFGKLGFPKMGVEGAALATTIARAIEAIALIFCVYKFKRYQVLAAKFKNLIRINLDFLKKFWNISFPVIVNESAWSLGITTYSIIYARMSTEAIASVNIVGSIERIAFVVLIGLAAGAATMVGNKIGEQKEEIAFNYAIRFSILSVLAALGVGFLIYISISPILGLFKTSTVVQDYAYSLMMVYIGLIPFRAFNNVNIVGNLRAGGDTKYCLFLDLFSLWIIGVPLAFLGAFYWKLPVYFVSLLAGGIEEVVKAILTFKRLKSRKWIRNLVRK